MTNDHERDAALDRALAQWGRHDAGDAEAVARIVRHADAITASSPVPKAPASAPSSRRLRSIAMGSGAIAASMALALILSSHLGKPDGLQPAAPGAAPDEGAPALAAAAWQVNSFAMLFTPTAEEETYL